MQAQKEPGGEGKNTAGPGGTGVRNPRRESYLLDGRPAFPGLRHMAIFLDRNGITIPPKTVARARALPSSIPGKAHFIPAYTMPPPAMPPAVPAETF